MQAGFDVTGYEISKPRAEYARNNLSLNVLDSETQLSKYSTEGIKFNFFYASHVLEHIPNIRYTIELAISLLKPGGYFVVFTPNGSDVFRKKQPKVWHNNWGFNHQIFLDDIFYTTYFKNYPYFLSSESCDFRIITEFHRNEDRKIVLSLDGPELLFLAKNHIST